MKKVLKITGITSIIIIILIILLYIWMIFSFRDPYNLEEILQEQRELRDRSIE